MTARVLRAVDGGDGSDATVADCGHDVVGRATMGMMRVDELPSGTVTFLMTDIEGSTRMWESHRDDMAEVLVRQERLVGSAVAANGGHRPLEQGEGDSAVAAFWRVGDALGAAVELQRGLAAESWPGGVSLSVRMSIHTGAATVRPDGTYRGVALHRCARIRALAHGGQVLVSELSASLAVDDLPAGGSLRDLGLHRLRDLTRVERLFQLDAPGLGEGFPALRSLDMVEHNLPGQLTSFVGRTRELAQLARLLDENRLVTLAGAGGCGKTRLALQAAADRAAVVGAVWFVELAPVADEPGVSAQLLRAAGLKEDPTRTVADLIAARVGEGSVLVVLDNCEHLVDTCARLTAELMAAIPALNVLATSREPLGIPGEVVSRVPSMAVPETAARALEIEESEAVLLLVDRCRLVRPGYQPDAEDLAHLGAICRRLDGIPLALELAAARMRVLAPADVAKGLDDRFRLLVGGGRSLLPRQQTLRASVDWSYSMLDDDERRTLRRLSVFAGGFTLDAAEAVAAGGGIDRYAVLDLVTRLVDKSLVAVDAEREPARFRLLETIRQYSEDRLVAADEAADARDHHAAYFAELSAQALPGLDGPALDTWVSRLNLDHDNLVAALAWSADRDDAATVWSMLGDLTFYWASAGRFGDARRSFDWCLAHDSDVTAKAQLPARWGAAHLAFYAADFGRGFELAIDALNQAESAGNDQYAARSLSTLGTMDMMGDPLSCIEKTSRAAELAGAAGDLWCATDAGQIAGYSHLICGQVDEGMDWLDRTAPGARRLDNPQLLAWDLAGRGIAAYFRGDLPASDRLFLDAARQAERTRDPNIIGTVIGQHCVLQAFRGEHDESIGNAEAALATARQTGAGQAEVSLLYYLTQVRELAGDLDGADRNYVDAIDLLEAVVPALAMKMIITGAAVAIRRGDLDEAAARLARGQALVPLGLVVDNATLDLLAAALDLERAATTDASVLTDMASAEDSAQRALTVFDQHGLAIIRRDALDLLAVIAAQRGQPIEATRIWGAVDTETTRLGLTTTTLSAWAAGHRMALLNDTEAAGAAYVEGTNLNIADAVSYVRRARGSRKRPSSGWDSLTPTEEQVVELAATGLSNPQIGEKLFVSAGTVKTHLSHVYTKLNIANRTELGAAFAQRNRP